MKEQNNWNDPQLSDGDFPQQNKTKFQVGDKAIKLKGYKFPCTIVSVFKTVEGNVTGDTFSRIKHYSIWPIIV